MNDFGKFCGLCDNEHDFKCGCDEGEDTTKMEVKYNGKAYAVVVCTTCEDDATPKVIRQHIEKQIDKYKKLVEDAAELGVTLSLEQLLQKKDGLLVVAPEETSITPTPVPVIPTPTPAPILQIQQPQQPQEPERLTDDKGNVIVHRQKATFKEMQHVESEMTGRPIAIPKKVVGNTGTTDYIIRQTTDAQLQERFRNLAAKSQPGQDSYSSTPYVPCGKCGGQGHSIIMKNGMKTLKICGTCDGQGFGD